MTLNETLMERVLIMNGLMRALHRGERKTPRGYAQDRALKAISSQEGISQRDLMEQMDVRPSSMSELLTKLEGSGLIERRQNPSDRRQVQLYLSNAGREQTAAMDEDDPMPDPFAVLSDEEKQQYLDMTNRMIDALLQVCRERGITPDHRPPYPRRGRPDGFREDFPREPRECPRGEYRGERCEGRPPMPCEDRGPRPYDDRGPHGGRHGDPHGGPHGCPRRGRPDEPYGCREDFRPEPHGESRCGRPPMPYDEFSDSPCRRPPRPHEGYPDRPCEDRPPRPCEEPAFDSDPEGFIE